MYRKIMKIGRKPGRYDFAAYSGFTTYSICSFAIPLVVVAMGKELKFPMDDGGMGAGGILHLTRSIGMVITILLCGAMAGRWGKRLTMGGSLALAGTGILLCAFANNYWLLIPFLLLAGLGEGICEGIITPFVQDLHPEAPERYVNIAQAFWSVGIGLSVILAGSLLEWGISWRVIVGTAGFLSILSSLLFLWKENPTRKYPESKIKFGFSTVMNYTGKIFRAPRFWVYCLGMFFGAGAEFCLTFWSATYMQLNFHTGPWVSGLGTGMIALGMFAGRAGFGCVATKKHLKTVMLITSLGTIPLSILLSVLKMEFFSSSALFFLVLFTLLFLSGIGISTFWPSLQIHGVCSLPELDSTMLYVYFSAVGIPSCGLFTWLVGVLGDHFGLRGAFLLIPGSLFFYALIIFLEGWAFPNPRKLDD